MRCLGLRSRLGLLHFSGSWKRRAPSAKRSLGALQVCGTPPPIDSRAGQNSRAILRHGARARSLPETTYHPANQRRASSPSNSTMLAAVMAPSMFRLSIFPWCQEVRPTVCTRKIRLDARRSACVLPPILSYFETLDLNVAPSRLAARRRSKKRIQKPWSHWWDRNKRTSTNVPQKRFRPPSSCI
jgi:hypothetical protein